MKCLVISSLLLASASFVQSVSWKRADTITAKDYMNKFYFFDGQDPTNGLVKYQSQKAAQQQKLVSVDGDSFYMKVDTTEEQTEGRPSVRLQSKNTYADAVYTHVPLGCSVWPSFWTTAPNQKLWPKGGEIDILENANDQYNYNLASAHVNRSCKIQPSKQKGTTIFNECNAFANENSGCRVAMNNTQQPTWGRQLNKKGGYVGMVRDFTQGGKGIRMWMWDDKNVPGDVKKPQDSVNPDAWGEPVVNLGLTQCADQFTDHMIVFTITLCGDWAADTSGNCKQKFNSCAEQVGKHGSSVRDCWIALTQYKDAYWQLHDLNVYTPNGKPSRTDVVAINPDGSKSGGKGDNSNAPGGKENSRDGTVQSFAPSLLTIVLPMLIAACAYLTM